MGFEVVINNFNRLSPFSKLVDWLKKAEGVSKITVIDNGSTYAPLLDYYQSATDLCIIKKQNCLRRENLSHYVHSLNGRFIITDADVVPHEDCPVDLVPKLDSVLKKYSWAVKVGPRLVWEDIPIHYPLREQVFRNQRKIAESNRNIFIPKEDCMKDGVMGCKIDTTFALYRDNRHVFDVTPAIATLAPYRFHHVDWYEDPKNMTEEFKFYIATANSLSTWTTSFRRVL